MRPTFDRRFWILLFIILVKCIHFTSQQKLQIQSPSHHYQKQPAASASIWRSIDSQRFQDRKPALISNLQQSIDDNEVLNGFRIDEQKDTQEYEKNCAKNCLKSKGSHLRKHLSSIPSSSITIFGLTTTSSPTEAAAQNQESYERSISSTDQDQNRSASDSKSKTQKKIASESKGDSEREVETRSIKIVRNPSQLASLSAVKQQLRAKVNPAKVKETHELKKVHMAHRNLHKEVVVDLNHGASQHGGRYKSKTHPPVSSSLRERTRRATRPDPILNTISPQSQPQTEADSSNADAEIHSTAVGGGVIVIVQEDDVKNVATLRKALDAANDFGFILPSEGPMDSSSTLYFNETYLAHSNGSANNDLISIAPTLVTKSKRAPDEDTQLMTTKHEPVIIIDDVEEFDSGSNQGQGQGLHSTMSGLSTPVDKSEDYSHDEPAEPRVLPLRPVLPNPYEDEEVSVVYAEQHSEIRLMCEVDLDIATSMWYKNGQVVHAMDRTSRATDYRFIKEANGALTITNVMLEDDGKWQCEAENTRRYTENARPVKLVVLDRPKPPYLLIDSRRLDAGNIFVPVKENSELNLACVSEGGNPKPTLTWEVLLSPGGDRHAQKVSAEVLELEEVKNNKDKNSYKINSGAKSEARLPAVYRAHHNARILCVMEHPTLKIRQNASLLLDVQYTPSFAISRTPGFGYPLREGIEVSLKCDVDSNPPSTPRWQKDDGETPVPQTGDGFLNFTSIRREHSGWYKCTSRHLNFQYSSIGYYLSVRYDSVDVTSEPDDQDISVAAASHNPNKGQLEVQLGGAVTLQCPQGSLGCWSHLDTVTARLRGLGHGLTTPTGQFSLKDVVYHDAGVYKCIGQSPSNKKKLEVLQTVGLSVKGAPTATPRNSTPVAYPGSPLHLSVEFCANPPAHAARWLHGDRVYTPGNQYGSTVLAYGVTDLPTPYCKEARLTYVSMHERVPRTFYFIVSSPGGVAEAVFKVNFTMRYRTMSNNVDDEEEELSEPEEIHFPVFGSAISIFNWRWHRGIIVFLFYFLSSWQNP